MVNLNELTEEQKSELYKQLTQESQEKSKRIKEDRSAYKKLVNETIPDLYLVLEEASQKLEQVKEKVFKDTKRLISLKAQAFDRDEDQFTHSFTTEDGYTITLGSRVYDSWDDTVTAGLSKVNEYLESLIKDKETAFLVGMIRDLLSKDKKGNLNSRNVLKLRQVADETGDPVFIDAVKIILDAYQPSRGREFITAHKKGENGEKIELNLSL